jgi:hypothetical protein
VISACKAAHEYVNEPWHSQGWLCVLRVMNIHGCICMQMRGHWHRAHLHMQIHIYYFFYFHVSYILRIILNDAACDFLIMRKKCHKNDFIGIYIFCTIFYFKIYNFFVIYYVCE